MAVTVLLSGCAASKQGLPYHFSGDFHTQVIYLSPVVAVERELRTHPDSKTEIYFTVGKAHREESELASDTGDRFENIVKGMVKRLGISPDGNWLVAESEDRDWHTAKAVSCLTGIALKSGKMYSATNVEALGKLVPGELASTELDAIDLFFDRSVILRFHDPMGD
jgi:hypothetical protein